jgi:hypothetical protein
VPGLVIAWRRPDLSLVLADRRTTCTDHVSRLVHRLALADRVRVHRRRAASLPGLAGTAIGASSPAATARPSAVHDARPTIPAGRAAGGQRTADRYGGGATSSLAPVAAPHRHDDARVWCCSGGSSR